MGNYRFMTDNLLVGADLSVSSDEAGLVGLAVKFGQGSAAAVSGGSYTGADERAYTIQIDSVSGGKEVGQATFRWNHSDSVSWEASGVATSASFITLENGVKIKWVSGSGDDFELNDKWLILCTKPFGRSNLYDWDRNTLFSSDGLDGPNWITADLGAAENVKACVILDHNLTANATITLQANSSDTWSSPAYSQNLTYNQGTMVEFLDQTYRYWRLAVSDAANPDGAIKLSQWFLGSYDAPNLLIRDRLSRQIDSSDPLLFPVEGLKFNFFCPSSQDVEDLVAIFKGQLEQTSRRMRPFFFCFDADNPDEATFMVCFDSKLEHKSSGPDSFVAAMNLTEVERKYV